MYRAEFRRAFTRRQVMPVQSRFRLCHKLLSRMRMSGLGSKVRARNGKKPAKGVVALNSGAGAEPCLEVPGNHSEWGLATRSQYQRQLCALEMELSLLRHDVEDLRQNYCMIDLAREHYVE